MKYYQVMLTYSCDICGARHLVKKGSDARIGEQEKNDLMVSGFMSLKKDFDIKHPEDTFNVERVVIEETNQLGQVRNLPVEKSKVEGMLGTVDITEQKGKGKKKSEEAESESISRTEEMSFEEIRNKVKVRITELQKANKECQEAMAKLGVQQKETRVEMLSLQSLLHATEESIKQYTKDKRKKKNGRKQKQKPICK